MPSDKESFEHLLRAKNVCISMMTLEEDYALGLVRDAALETTRELCLWTCTRGLRDGLISDGPVVAQTEHPAAALYQLARRTEQGFLCVMLDLAVHLADTKTLRMFRDLLKRFRETGSQLILIDHITEPSPLLVSEATSFEISLPDEQELELIVRETLRRIHEEKPIDIQITRNDLRIIVRNLRGLTRRQAQQVIMDTVSEDHRFDSGDINTVLACKRRALQTGGLLEYVESPVDLTDIGGLSRLKLWLQQRQDAMTEKAVQYGLTSPRGVLMLGVQGAGKSLCAKAIATAWHRPLLRMDVGALYDRYVGESERRLRDALRQAEMMSPIVLWIDEIEKAFASAASRSTDGGLSQRMFGSLLTWMQEHRAGAFLVATANDIEALPPELLRKGRFDEIFFVDLPSAGTRKQIFAIHLRKRKREPEKFDLEALANASDGYSGAEIEQSIIAAMHETFTSQRDLTTDAVVKTLAASPPLSVTMAEQVQALRAWARNRCVPAD